MGSVLDPASLPSSKFSVSLAFSAVWLLAFHAVQLLAFSAG